jgi:CsoR family transcriptional regulator, copper-sensing transcriptional repressor
MLVFSWEYSRWGETMASKIVKDHGEAAACGCGARDKSRKASQVDPEIKSSNLKRLRRIEGQVRGLQRLVAEDRYCADILVQLSSVQEALRSVGRALMKNHLRHCAADAIRDTAPGRAEAMYKELLNLMQMQSR